MNAIPAPVSEAPEPQPKLERRSPGLMTTGIVAAALSPVGLVVALMAWGDQESCESQRDAESLFWDFPIPNTSPPKIYHCDNTGAIVGGVVGTVVLLGAGIPLIIYGAKKVPVETNKTNETAVRFVPWTHGTTGAGGSLQFRF